MRGYLQQLGVAWQDEPRLVRGLDYYTRTTFEFAHSGLGAQSAIGGGGRYDGLLETLGGQPLPGIGFGLGVDRTLLACVAEGVAPAPAGRVDVFLIPLGDQAKERLVALLADLRTCGVRADLEYGGKGLKGAMKSADRSGATFTVVVGDRDLAQNAASVKEMASGHQESVSLTDIVTILKGRLA